MPDHRANVAPPVRDRNGRVAAYSLTPLRRLLPDPAPTSVGEQLDGLELMSRAV